MADPPRERLPVRVLHVHSSIGVFGAERWTHLLLRYADRSRAALTVLTMGSRSENRVFADFLAQDGFSVVHLAQSKRALLRTVAATRRLIRERGIDVVHAHGFKSEVVSYLATRATGVALSTTAHGSSAMQSRRIRLYESLARVFLPAFERVFTVSAHQAALLRDRLPPERVRVIANAVDIEPLGPIFAERARRGAPEATRVLYVGRLSWEKGVLDLIEAFARGGHRRGVDQLIVAGEGPDREKAERLTTALGIRKDVEFLGFRPDVRPLLLEATVLALPSYSEGLPRVVMEAFAAGVPVVGTDIPGIREVVDDGVTGLLVPCRDPTALAAALARVSREPEMVSRIVGRARAVVEERHAPGRMADEVCAEYEDLVHRRRIGRHPGTVA